MGELIELKFMQQTEERDQHIVEKSVQLSLIEVVIGSGMHALHLPFSGHLLSLNQGFLLCRYLKDSNNRISGAKMVMEVSSVAAIMKALSPVGKKLGPMISISMQGFLFMLGIFGLGRGLIGQMLAMALLSIWAFIQPLITYFVIYGSDLASAVAYFSKKQEAIIDIIYFVVIAKAIIAATIPLALYFISDQKILNFENKIKAMSFPKKMKAKRSAIAELFRPSFLLSLGLMISFFYFSGESAVAIFWKCLRALAIAFVIFYLARNSYIHRFFAYLATKNKVIKRLYDLSRKAVSQITNLK